MKTKPLFLLALGAGALAGWLAAPAPTMAQTDADSGVIATLVAELTVQQTALSDNLTKMDDQIAIIAENVRVARIFSSRGGGKK